MVVPNKRLIAPFSGKRASALRVAPENAPLGVARCSFGMTKPRASRLDWRILRCNSNYSISVNRPKQQRGSEKQSLLSLAWIAGSFYHKVVGSDTNGCNIMLVYAGDALAKYGFGEGHPFGPDRFHAFWKAFLTLGLDQRCSVLPPVDGAREDLLLFHSPEYVQHVERMSEQGVGMLDPDTPIFSGAYEAALTVVGSVLDAVTRIVDGEDSAAFVPIAGLHHARRSASAGFCIFNDCGIAVEALRHRHGLRRIAYVDIDAHHGDGVFYAFEGDPELIIADMHEDGRFLYPGTGHGYESGKGEAAGTKLNLPLLPGSDDTVFFKHWPEVADFIENGEPEFIILQCGADSLKGDPITSLSFSSAAHHHAAQSLYEIARRCGSKGLLALGGGGYNRDNIAKAWTAVVRGIIEAERA